MKKRICLTKKPIPNEQNSENSNILKKIRQCAMLITSLLTKMSMNIDPKYFVAQKNGNKGRQYG